jgi:hypothetical protein
VPQRWLIQAWSPIFEPTRIPDARADYRIPDFLSQHAYPDAEHLATMPGAGAELKILTLTGADRRSDTPDCLRYAFMPRVNYHFNGYLVISIIASRAAARRRGYQVCHSSRLRIAPLAAGPDDSLEILEAPDMLHYYRIR